MPKFFEKSIIEEEFKRRRARLTQDETYFNRGSSPKYFTESKKGSQAILKVINHHGRIRDLVKYVTDEKRTGDDGHIYDFTGRSISKERLQEIESFWHQRNKQETRSNSRHSTHFVFSTKEKPTKKNIEILRYALSTVASQHFEAEGFDYIFTIHTNTAHLHGHLVLHNKNLITGKKIRLSRYSSLFTLRKDFADRLKDKGLNYVCSAKQDAMEVSSELETSNQTQNQNYVLNQVENDLGTDARDWSKKQFINKYSEDDKKAEEAKANLKLIKKRDDPNAKAEILKRVNLYKRQKEKWQIKQFMQNKYKKLDKKDINAYVDTLYATENTLSSRYNSKNNNSVTRLEKIQERISDLTQIDVSARIINYKEFKERQKARDQEIQNFNLYGEVGKQYLRTLYSNLDYSKTDQQREVVSTKIANLKDGNVSEEEFDFFRNSLKKASPNLYNNFYDQRIEAIKSEIAKETGVEPEDIDQVEKIFELHCARRVKDSFFAYRQFKRGLKLYKEVLKSGDEDRLWYLSNGLSQKLGKSPLQMKMREEVSQSEGISF
jgi:hypothetical protein